MIYNKTENTTEAQKKARRERIAVAALQGLIARGFIGEHAAVVAVGQADALIKELDK